MSPIESIQFFLIIGGIKSQPLELAPICLIHGWAMCSLQALCSIPVGPYAGNALWAFGAVPPLCCGFTAVSTGPTFLPFHLFKANSFKTLHDGACPAYCHQRVMCLPSTFSLFWFLPLWLPLPHVTHLKASHSSYHAVGVQWKNDKRVTGPLKTITQKTTEDSFISPHNRTHPLPPFDSFICCKLWLTLYSHYN